METARRTVLFRVAQEALTNVSRHAQASRVEMSIQKRPDGICMKIKDDGKSFQVDRMLKPGQQTPRIARHEGTRGDGRRHIQRRIRTRQRHHHHGANSTRQNAARPKTANNPLKKL